MSTKAEKVAAYIAQNAGQGRSFREVCAEAEKTFGVGIFTEAPSAFYAQCMQDRKQNQWYAEVWFTRKGAWIKRAGQIFHSPEAFV
jgi:hypothetical protein